MNNKAIQIKFLTLIALVVGFAWGNVINVSAQQGNDPFSKPNWAKPKDPNAKVSTTTKDGKTVTKVEKPLPPPVVPVGVPPIQDRINYYKRIRQIAAERGDENLPKVTSVLTLSEMSVTGIFKTPRGYAAMVQATPISLSYPVYPGEKFFDGQLVAIEENRLVFRKVIKMSNGKFVTSEENKTLRAYTQEEELQGTAPVDSSAKADSKPAESAKAGQPVDPNKPVQPVSIVSPLDEMNRQPAETPKSAKEKSSDKNKKSSATKKTVKVATNKKP